MIIGLLYVYLVSEAQEDDYVELYPYQSKISPTLKRRPFHQHFPPQIAA